MSAISLKAHFDGESIRLDEPFELPVNAQLIVTVVSTSSDDDGRAEWSELSRDGLTRAYGTDEPEYSEADIRP